MKTIGLLGGMSWESSAHYYAILNREVRTRLGNPHSARCVLLSVDFGEVAPLQHVAQWEALGDMLATHGRDLAAAGADCILLCTNTMHLLAERIEAAAGIPLLHIADATGRALAAAGIKRAGLLGTRFTMEQPFYRERLRSRFGIEALIPEEADRAEIHRIIYDELVAGVVTESARERYQQAIARLADAGAEAIILGCTEIMLLIQQQHSALPLFDTTTLHALAGVSFALS